MRNTIEVRTVCDYKNGIETGDLHYHIGLNLYTDTSELADISYITEELTKTVGHMEYMLKKWQNQERVVTLMKNKEYVLQNHTDDLLNLISEYGICNICKTVGCADYCKSNNSPCTCKETFEAWLNMKHTEELFPLGAIVEFNTCSNSSYTKRLGYYNGCVGDNQHCVCIYKENIGKSNVGLILDAEAIKKVGD